ncbi:DsrE family protein [Pseudoroseomonas cervicalis]|uniref:DsrE family protein n=1 Tax=Teichococcus cervicalis TaxID=204525 RepID=UPI002782DF62|nr:DsrE family protein [Pseudoroseomonas cervicalis]MDQ1081153.1 putative peroxiredoxin [Pseudoroseomonas cervicalis]
MSAPLGILLRSPGHEPAHYALMLATGAAAIGRPVILFATNAGCHLFLRRTRLLADEREAVLARRNVVGIAPLLDAAQDLGVRRLVCEAGLRAEGLDPAELAPGVEITGVVTFLGAVGAGQMLSL